MLSKRTKSPPSAVRIRLFPRVSRTAGLEDRLPAKDWKRIAYFIRTDSYTIQPPSLPRNAASRIGQ